MIRLNNFTGGVNLRLTPNLLKADEAIELKNIDTDSNSLCSIKDVKPLNEIVDKVWTYFDICDKVVSFPHSTTFIEYNHLMYSSEQGTIKVQGCDGVKHSVSILNESIAPLPVVEDEAGNLKGIYKYLYTYYNNITDIESIPTVLSIEADTNRCPIVPDIIRTDEYNLFSANYKALSLLLSTIDELNCKATLDSVLCTFTSNNVYIDPKLNDIQTIMNDLWLSLDLPQISCVYKIESIKKYIDSFHYLYLDELSYKELYFKALAISKTTLSKELKLNAYASLVRDLNDISVINDPRYYDLITSFVPLINTLTVYNSLGVELPFSNITYHQSSLYIVYTNYAGGALYTTEIAETNLGIIECKLREFELAEKFLYTSDNIEICETAKITISGFTPNNEATNIRLYRIGGTSAEYRLVEELPINTSTYTDDIADIDLGDVLDSFNNYPPPLNITNITTYHTMLVGSVGNKVYFTDVNKPYAWSPTNYIEYPHNITGLGVTQNGLLVFSAYTTYIVVGNDPLTLSNYMVSKEYGCINHHSIQFTNNMLVWVSRHGICASNGGSIINLTTPKLNRVTLDSINAISIDNIYYLSLTNGTTLLLDNRFNNFSIKYIKYSGYLGVIEDRPTIAIDNTLNTLFAGDLVDFNYVSPIFDSGKFTEYGIIKDIYIKYKGSITVKVFTFTNTNKILVFDKQLDDTKVEANIKLDGRYGSYGIQFNIQGIGCIHEIIFTKKDMT